MSDALRGLYAITDSTTSPIEVERALFGGARIIQYRDKSDDQARRLNDARTLKALCADHGVPLIINDDIELAAKIGADGVHLGRDDHAIEKARSALGDCIIGISCYNAFDLALEAARAGADYVAFGAFFPSPTKPQAVRAEPTLLMRAKQELEIPVVAIGGITPDNGAPLIDAGADMLAVISGVFGQADITAAARRFSRLFG